jgi:hypothetical protein
LKIRNTFLFYQADCTNIFNLGTIRTNIEITSDLILESSKGEITAIEIKRTLSPKLTPAFRESMQTVAATKGFYLIPEGDQFPLSSNVEACGLYEFLGEIES